MLLCLLSDLLHNLILCVQRPLHVSSSALILTPLTLFIISFGFDQSDNKTKIKRMLFMSSEMFKAGKHSDCALRPISWFLLWFYASFMSFVQFSVKSKTRIKVYWNSNQTWHNRITFPQWNFELRPTNQNRKIASI